MSGLWDEYGKTGIEQGPGAGPDGPALVNPKGGSVIAWLRDTIGIGRPSADLPLCVNCEWAEAEPVISRRCFRRPQQISLVDGKPDGRHPECWEERLGACGRRGRYFVPIERP